MDIVNIVFIAAGLAMDAFAVSIADGLILKCNHMRRALLLGAVFGGFQALMPLLGWILGIKLRTFISSYDHWVAFVILFLIGAKMIQESFKLDEGEKRISCDCPKTLMLLGIATSIDALSVGVSFAVLGNLIIYPALIIGVITFIFCFLGVFVGAKVGHFFEGKIELFGGLCLIAIALKILLRL